MTLSCLGCRVSLSFLAGMLAACAHYQAAPRDPVHDADQFAARRLGEVPLRDDLAWLLPQAAAQWPPREWDRAELLAVALTHYPLAVARAQVNAARSREITAAEMPNPDVTLQSEYARHDPHPWLYGVSLNWLLRSPERRRLETQIAGLDTGVARIQLLDQALAVRSAIAAALSDWEGGRRRLTLLAPARPPCRNACSPSRSGGSKAGEDPPSELLVEPSRHGFRSSSSRRNCASRSMPVRGGSQKEQRRRRRRSMMWPLSMAGLGRASGP